MLSVFSYQNIIEIETNSRKIFGNILKIWKLNKTLFLSPQIKKTITMEIKEKKSEWNENTAYMRCS